MGWDKDDVVITNSRGGLGCPVLSDGDVLFKGTFSSWLRISSVAFCTLQLDDFIHRIFNVSFFSSSTFF